MAGQLPAVALADEIEAGHVRALVVTGGNPITAFPEPDRLRAALARLDVLAVVDVCEQRAHASSRPTSSRPRVSSNGPTSSIAELTAVRSGLQATGAGRAAGGRATAGLVDARLARARGWAATCSAAPTRTTSPTSSSSAACSRGHRSTRRRVLRRRSARRRRASRARLGARDDAARRPLAHRPAAMLVARLAAHRDPARTAWSSHPGARWRGATRCATPAREPSRWCACTRTTPAAAGLDGRRPGSTVRSAHGAMTATSAVDGNVRPGVVSMTHGRAAAAPAG